MKRKNSRPMTTEQLAEEMLRAIHQMSPEEKEQLLQELLKFKYAEEANLFEMFHGVQSKYVN